MGIIIFFILVCVFLLLFKKLPRWGKILVATIPIVVVLGWFIILNILVVKPQNQTTQVR